MKVFVGCSSRNEIPTEFLNLALQVGELLKEEEVIIGGTKIGMMGNVVNNIPLKQVKQIILKDYVKEGMTFQNSYQICNSSFERLNEIWKQADVLLILPGGTGTLGEIFFFLEENRMNLEKKHLILFNDQDYYDEIITFIEKLKQLNFVNEAILDGLNLVFSLKELMNCLERIKHEIF